MKNLSKQKFKILSLDGGGSKGMYTLGVLHGLEGMLKNGSLAESFDMLYGTSTGAIISAFIGMGKSISEIKAIYLEKIPEIMKQADGDPRSRALIQLAEDEFGEATFKEFKTRVSIVTTNDSANRPTIFKADPNQAYAGKGTFKQGFGCTIKDAVVASASAIPYFSKHTIVTEDHGEMTLIDGGFVANNPSLFAMIDATNSLKLDLEDISLVSIGCGSYATSEMPKNWLETKKMEFLEQNFPLDLLATTLASNSNTTEIMVNLMFPTVTKVRINEAFTENYFTTNLLESDAGKLNTMYTHGQNSFRKNEATLMKLLDV